MMHKGFVISPDSTLKAAVRISPFDDQDIFRNRKMPDSLSFDHYFTQRFPDYQWQFTTNGRDAIRQALICEGLRASDEVAILTTTGNFYISSCVTNEISRICRWSREITSETKMILVNHEFGFPFEKLRELKNYGLPIMEDCAHSFLSDNTERSAGTVGDYLVFSLPKFFPIQNGGILCTRKPGGEKKSILSPVEASYIRNTLGFYTPYIRYFASQRIRNYQRFSELFAERGYQPRFILNNQHVPGVFMFVLKPGEEGQKLKDYLWKNGIESSVFYQENAVYIPVHHRLTAEHIEFIFEIIINYLES